ncbi:MAG: DUF805 domain-containing protein [Kiritimatiellae bacterium]|nr:DUF805 domain-containing protein [Kiritimatiellia bacterium]MBR6586603.1 DUF805 domain-containing protein [Kiritimatiellia bacterium]
MNYFIDCLTKKYACFSGRARRQEYWMFVLFNIIACIIVGVISGVLVSVTNVTAFAYLGTIYSLAVLIPGFAVLFRRLHDTGRSGWWWLIGFIPLIGAIVLIIFCCLDSQPGENQYGPNPKGL